MDSKTTRNRLDVDEEEPVLSDSSFDSASEDPPPSSSDEDILSHREKRPKLTDRTSNENRPPKEKGTDSELSKTNALLQTLLKRQEKKLCEMESKLTQSSAPSSSDSTPHRRSAAERRKEVPQEVRVSTCL